MTLFLNSAWAIEHGIYDEVQTRQDISSAEMQRFETEIMAKINKLDAKLMKDRQAARADILSILKLKGLPNSKRLLIVNKLKEAAPSSKEVRDFIRDSVDNQINWQRLFDEVEEDFKAHPRLAKFRGVLDLIFGNFTEDEARKYQSMSDKIQEKTKELDKKLMKMFSKIEGFINDGGKLDLKDPAFSEIKKIRQEQEKLEDERNQLLSSVLNKKDRTFSKLGYSFVVEPFDCKHSCEITNLVPDDLPQEKAKIAKEFQANLQNAYVRKNNISVLIKKGNDKFPLGFDYGNDIEIFETNAKDTVVPLKKFLLQSKEYVALPNGATAKDMKAIPITMSLSGNFKSPAYIPNFSYTMETTHHDDEDGGLVKKDFHFKPMANYAAAYVLKEQFSDRDSKEAIEGMLDSVAGQPAPPKGMRHLETSIMIMSERPSMKNKNIDLELLPIKKERILIDNETEAVGPMPDPAPPIPLVPKPKVH